MKFTLEIELPDDDFLKMDNRELVAKACTRIATDLSYDRIYKRPLVVGTENAIEVMDTFSDMIPAGKWTVSQ